MTFLTFDLVFDPLGKGCFWQQLVFNAKWPPEQDGMVEIQMWGGGQISRTLVPEYKVWNRTIIKDGL